MIKSISKANVAKLKNFINNSKHNEVLILSKTVSILFNNNNKCDKCIFSINNIDFIFTKLVYNKLVENDIRCLYANCTFGSYTLKI